LNYHLFIYIDCNVIEWHCVWWILKSSNIAFLNIVMEGEKLI